MPQANAYGTTSPRALEPNPIETTLAQLAAGGSSANAQNMLDTYQAQRQQAEGEYSLDLENQHQFAKQQLSQQMQENYIKALTEAPKTAGTLSLLQGSGMVPGIDPNVARGIETNLARAQTAKTAQEGGAGLSSLDTAGYQTSPDEATNLTGITNLKSGISRAERVANINAAGRVAAASIGANKPSPGPGFSIPLPLSSTGGQPITANIPGKLGYDGGMAYLRNHNLLPPVGQTTPGVVQPPAGDTPAPAGRTSLPMAKQDTPANAPTGSMSPAMQQAVADVKAAATKNGGKPVPALDASGKQIGIKGATGKVYTN